MSRPHIVNGAMDHDYRKENRSRADNRYPGCSCPDWRYSPSVTQLRPTNPECPEHGGAS